MIRQISWLMFSVSMLFLLDPSPARGSEQEFTELIRGSARIVIGTPENSADLREVNSVKVNVDRALRGPGVKGQILEITHDGGDSAPKFEADQQYVILLRPHPEHDGWVYVGSAALPYRDGSLQLESAEAAAITLEKLQAFIDKFPASADMMLPSRTTPGGRWIVKIVMQPSDDSPAKIEMPLWILDLKKQGEGYAAEMIAHSKEFNEAKIADFTYADETIRFSIDVTTASEKPEHHFKFEGRFQDGAVQGNLSVDQGPARLAQMKPTSARNLQEFDPNQTLAGQDVLDKATEAEDEYAAYRQFITDYPGSPLVLDAYLKMLASESVVRLSEQELRDLVNSYQEASRQWGEEIRQKAVIDAALIVSEHKSHPNLSLELIGAAESQLTDSSPDYLKAAIALQRPLMLWESDDREQAISMLEEFRKKHPLNGISNYHLARMYEQEQKTDQALMLYAELVALPNTLEMVNNTFENEKDYTPLLDKLDELWRNKFGNRQGLFQFSVNAYYSALHNYTDERIQPREKPEGAANRVALLELMTGAACPTCVAADLASTIMEHIYPRSELIVLRYHLHNAGPDPMASSPSDQRLAYYEGRGIPTVAINGETLTGGGYIVHVPEMIQRYRALVDAVLDDTVDVEIKLSAIAEEGKIQISAEALRPEGFEGDLKLRIVLAEERLIHKANNGILLHDNVVRRMVGGEAGISPQDGKLVYNGEVDLEEFQRDLETYLTGFEDLYNNQTGQDFEFEFRPTGPHKLNLIAFVQDDATKNVLQAAMVPVSVNSKPAE